MTGGTSGFGAVTADRLRSTDDTRLILGVRKPGGPGESLPLYLTELDSVRTFATSVLETLDDGPVDALVLNAGLIRSDAFGRTVGGFETTFAVNHLAHYLLLRLLMPALADNAIVVLTTSGTHDPATKGGLATPRHADAEMLAHPEHDPGLDSRARTAGEHAYTASKLCTVLTARWLASQRSELRVVAYCPGQVFGTGLAQDLPIHMRMAWSLLGTPVGWPLRKLNSNLNTRADAANTLADLALGVGTPPTGHTYAALRGGRLTWPDPSELARSDELADALWTDSARLIGLED